MLAKKRGGRKRITDTNPQLKVNFQRVLEDHTAGNPMIVDALWTNLSLQAIADRLGDLGTPVGRSIVQQLLDHFDLGRRQALKRVSMGQSRHRNKQFETVALYKKVYLDSANPIISIDTKKRELLGLFYRDGQLFTAKGMPVFDHDFPSFAKGVVIPHGIFDLKRA